MKTKETSATKRRGDTRTKLILAAEKLFGDQGVHGVTLKEINAVAGQRNESALHYHFGSKAALVDAILLHRARDIDEVRQQRLEALIAQNKQNDLRGLMHATFMPMMELLSHADGIGYVRFLAQVLNDPDFDLPSIAMRGGLPGIVRANLTIVAALDNLPPEIALQRLRFLIEMMVSSMAIWTRHHDALTEVAQRELFIANLFDSMVGFIAAPLSAQAKEALKKAKVTPDP